MSLLGGRSQFIYVSKANDHACQHTHIIILDGCLVMWRQMQRKFWMKWFALNTGLLPFCLVMVLAIWKKKIRMSSLHLYQPFFVVRNRVCQLCVYDYDLFVAFCCCVCFITPLFRCCFQLLLLFSTRKSESLWWLNFVSWFGLAVRC